MNKPIVYSLLGVLGLGAVLVPVFAHDEQGAVQVAPFDLDSPRRPSKETAKYINLQTAQADFGSLEEVIKLTGMVRVIPDRLQLVTSAVQGTVGSLNFRVGDRVKRGDQLAVIQSPELAKLIFELHQTEVEYEKADAEVVGVGHTVENGKRQVAVAEAQAKLIEDEVARLEAGGEAVSANILSSKRSAAVQARSQVASLQLTVERASRMLESAKRIKVSTGRSIEAMNDAVNLIHSHTAGETDPEFKAAGGKFSLFARVDGTVRRRDAAPGQVVEAGKILLEIADYRQVMIEGELPESLAADMSRIRGLEVRVRRAGSNPGDPPVAVGRVVGVGPLVDPVKRTGHLLIMTDNPGAADGYPALLDGGFVTLAVVVRAVKDAVVVPASAVVSDGPMHFVFIKDGDTYTKRDIVPGLRDDRMVEVLDGIVPGDEVVPKGAYALTQLRPKLAAEAHDEHDHGHDHDHGHKH